MSRYAVKVVFSMKSDIPKVPACTDSLSLIIAQANTAFSIDFGPNACFFQWLNIAIWTEVNAKSAIKTLENCFKLNFSDFYLVLVDQKLSPNMKTMFQD